MKKFLTIFISLIMIFLTGCTSSKKAQSIAEQYFVPMEVGDEVYIRVENENDWVCDNIDIVDVDKTGKGHLRLYAVSDGIAVLKKDNKTYYISICDSILSKGFKYKIDDVFVDMKDSIYSQVVVEGILNDQLRKMFAFKVDDSKIASVTSNGLVVGKTIGVTRMKVIDKDSGLAKIINIVVTGNRKQVEYVKEYDSGSSGTAAHVQGIASDYYGDYFYYCFTDRILKMNSSGQIVASVVDIPGHMGDCAFDYKNNKLIVSWMKHTYYGDAALRDQNDERNANFIIISVDKLNKIGMKPADDFVETVYLSDAITQYSRLNGFDEFGKELSKEFIGLGGRYGLVNGIGSATIGPKFGASKDDKQYITFGISCRSVSTAVKIKDSDGNIIEEIHLYDRVDSDYLVIGQIEMEKLYSYAGKFSESDTLESIKDFDGLYFYYCGMHDYGIQTLCYDDYSKSYIVSCYNVGDKNKFPNYSLFCLDSSFAIEEELKGNPGETGKVLKAKYGLKDEKTGIYGNVGGFYVGLLSMNDGFFYGAKDYKTSDNMAGAKLKLYKWTLTNEDMNSGRYPFEIV